MEDQRTETGIESQSNAVGRRSYLKLVGATVPALAVGTARGSATEQGYGEGGYGTGEYGGAVAELVVQSNTATDVSAERMTVAGELTDLGGASSVEVYFEWRASGSKTATTSTQTLTAPGTFSADLTGLSSGTTYEFRAVATASDGDTASGALRTATTLTAAPVVEHYDVSATAGSGSVIDVTADWAVSDATDDLDSVLLVVFDGNGRVTGARAVDVDGRQASGTTSLQFDSGDSTEFSVRVAVTDTAGHVTTQATVVSP